MPYSYSRLADPAAAGKFTDPLSKTCANVCESGNDLLTLHLNKIPVCRGVRSTPTGLKTGNLYTYMLSITVNRIFQTLTEKRISISRDFITS